MAHDRPARPGTQPPKPRTRHREPRESAASKHLRQEVGFTLRLRDSTIPTAGLGVFLEGQARIGSVVAIFPGSVYLPEHLKTQEHVAGLFPDPDFFLTQRSVCTVVLQGCGPSYNSIDGAQVSQPSTKGTNAPQSLLRGQES